jgi:hypothetical protein
MNTMVLTESQRGVLQIALEIAVDRFKDHARNIGDLAGLADQFERQADTAQTLLSLVACADAVLIMEENE